MCRRVADAEMAWHVHDEPAHKRHDEATKMPTRIQEEEGSPVSHRLDRIKDTRNGHPQRRGEGTGGAAAWGRTLFVAE